MSDVIDFDERRQRAEIQRDLQCARDRAERRRHLIELIGILAVGLVLIAITAILGAAR